MSDKRVPKLPAQFPQLGNRVTRSIGHFFLSLMGWRITGSFPETNKVVLAVAPHTSNWDFFVGLAAMFALGLKAHWLGKHTIFIWPIKRLLTAVGGVPVNRGAAKDVVSQVAERFEQSEALILALAPEGTRKQTPKLKTGFIRMAIAAKVPVFLIGFDFPTKEIVLGELYHPTGDVDVDEKAVRSYFYQFKGRNPDQYCPKDAE
jgi:1-acyl-sn-glycerol-3-phosphate acyltransferase